MSQRIVRRGSHRSPLRVLAFALALALCAGAACAQPSPAAPVPASWSEHELDFDYMGFTTRYSCDGLSDKVRRILLALGARADLSISTSGCIDQWDRRDLLKRFDPVPSLKIRFASLQPASATGAGQVQGAWRNVDFVGNQRLEPGDCELVEALTRQVVPLFAVRNLQTNASCTPHYLPVSLSLHLEAFSLAAAP
jgi:hypothetical protein